MPSPVYMKIDKIEGSVSNPNKETDKSIEILKFEHKVYMPTRKLAKVASGVRQHEEFLVVKNMDLTSPLLFQKLCDQDELQVDLFWFIVEKGSENRYYRHTLKQAKIESIRNYMPDREDPNQQHLNHMEEVTFSYKIIEWAYGNSENEDPTFEDKC